MLAPKKTYTKTHLFSLLGILVLGILCFSFFFSVDQDAAIASTPPVENSDVSFAEDDMNSAEENGFFSYSLKQVRDIHERQKERDKIKSLTQKDDTSYYPDRNVFTLKKNTTLADLLSKAGLDSSEAYKMIEAMRTSYSPRSLRSGQKFTIFYDTINNKRTAVGLQFAPDATRHIIVLKNTEDNTYSSQEILRTLEKTIIAKSATIETALSVDGQKAGIPYSILSELIAAYSWDVDFQRDLRKGDTVEIVFESLSDEDGNFVKTGDMLYANLTIQKDPIEVWRFEDNQGDVDYFKRDGKSVRRALMRTPIDGARLSSGFGMRHHPILGYNKMHKGVDFAAPRGTPIFAAGDGTIEYIGRNGGYGNYIRIRHTEGLKTAYAHMKGFAKGMHKGKRVKQKQVIGYLGNTGRSTGPHLHFEVHKNNAQVNPRTVKLPKGKSLKGNDFTKFTSYLSDFDDILSSARIEGKDFALNQ